MKSPLRADWCLAIDLEDYGDSKKRMNTARRPQRDCTKLSPIESLLQYRFATSKPLKARPGPEGCRTAPFRKPYLFLGSHLSHHRQGRGDAVDGIEFHRHSGE